MLVPPMTDLRAGEHVAEQDHEYLTVPEVAEHYRTTEGTVRYWRHIGHGPKGVRLGTRVLYPRAEIERFDRQLSAAAATKASA
jgi:Helix-turn-helix domain